ERHRLTQTRPEDNTYNNYSDRHLTPEAIDIVDATISQSDLRLRRRGLADLHMHTTYSDGTGTVEDALDFAEKHTSLAVVAITDYAAIEGALRAGALAAAHPCRVPVSGGEELSTREGHLLALVLQRAVAPGQSIERSIEQVHAQGGLAIVAHPFNRVFRFSV